MSIAAFVLGLVATVLAVVSLAWQMLTRAQQSARPRLTPVFGLLTADGLITTDTSCDVRESLLRAADKFEDGPIVGVKVMNAGRAPLHVAGWAMRSEPNGASLIPVDGPKLGNEVPCDIAPGESAIFATELQRAHRFSEATASIMGQQRHFVFTVSSGARTFVSKPLSSELFSLQAAMPEPDSD